MTDDDRLRLRDLLLSPVPWGPAHCEEVRALAIGDYNDRAAAATERDALAVEVERLAIERDDARCVACGGPVKAAENAALRAEVARLTRDLAEAQRDFLACAEAVGVALVADGHSPVAGPVDVVVSAIRRGQETWHERTDINAALAEARHERDEARERLAWTMDECARRSMQLDEAFATQAILHADLAAARDLLREALEQRRLATHGVDEANWRARVAKALSKEST